MCCRFLSAIWPPENVFRSDAMHLIKLGIGRHFLASAVVVLGDFDVYNGSASGVAKLLEYAHKDFMYTCKQEVHQTPNLKQFTREGFHGPRRTSYPLGGSMDALMKGFIGQTRHSRCMQVSKTGINVCIRVLDFCKLPYKSVGHASCMVLYNLASGICFPLAFDSPRLESLRYPDALPVACASGSQFGIVA